MPNSVCSGTMTTSMKSPLSHFSRNHLCRKQEVKEEVSDECREVLLSLPRERGWRSSYLYKFQNFWCQAEEIQAIIAFQKHFRAKSSDVIVTSIPKSGTTWLKALTFAITKRHRLDVSSRSHPLLNSNPHDLVPFLEYKLYAKNQIPNLSDLENPHIVAKNQIPILSDLENPPLVTKIPNLSDLENPRLVAKNSNLSDLEHPRLVAKNPIFSDLENPRIVAETPNHSDFENPRLVVRTQIPNLSDLQNARVVPKTQTPNFENPRLFATHVPFNSLGDSIKTSNCKIVYICRNPFDTFVSSWHFINKLRPNSMPSFSIEEGFDLYCRGVIGFGPFWDHMMGYYKSSLENPNKVLFLKYEDLKDDVVFELKKLARFLGFPFTEDEERDGTVEEIARLCSFESMKELEVNKNGKSIKHFENKNLFRKAEVGDYVNYLSPSMVDRLAHVMKCKMANSQLTFDS